MKRYHAPNLLRWSAYYSGTLPYGNPWTWPSMIPYSWKYWQSLNLAVLAPNQGEKILAEYKIRWWHLTALFKYIKREDGDKCTDNIYDDVIRCEVPPPNFTFRTKQSVHNTDSWKLWLGKIWQFWQSGLKLPYSPILFSPVTRNDVMHAVALLVLPGTPLRELYM